MTADAVKVVEDSRGVDYPLEGGGCESFHAISCGLSDGSDSYVSFATIKDCSAPLFDFFSNGVDDDAMRNALQAGQSTIMKDFFDLGELSER